jgi:hypothetical protein
MLGFLFFYAIYRFAPLQGLGRQSFLLNGIATAMITVSLFELLKLLIQLGLYRFTFRRAFDQFFGDDASSDSAKGIIYLQSDEVQALVNEFTNANISPIKIDYSHRSYKARKWVNRWDIAGGRALRDEFLTRGLSAPKVTPVDREQTEFNIPPNIPFAISMGLGFNDATNKLIDDLAWMHIQRDRDYGDALYLRQELVPRKLQQLSPREKNDALHIQEGFIRILPHDWNIDKWLRSPGESRDFAIILRRTFKRSDGKRQVRFVLAGFTEKGTAAAGAYLSWKWKDLWKNNVYGRTESLAESFGDFLVLIEGPSLKDGPSDSLDISHWSEDPCLPAIIPSTIKEKLGRDSNWSNLDEKMRASAEIKS